MKFLSVRKNTLLLIASIVWLAAGVNIARIGLEAYAAGHLTLLNIVLSAVVGIVFWTFIFGKLVVKHTARITGYEEERHFDPRVRPRPRGVHRGVLHRPRVRAGARRPALRLHVATRGPRYPRLTLSHSELSRSVVRDSRATPPS